MTGRQAVANRVLALTARPIRARRGGTAQFMAGKGAP